MAQVLVPSQSGSPFASRPLSRDTSAASLVSRNPDVAAGRPPASTLPAGKGGVTIRTEPFDRRTVTTSPASSPIDPKATATVDAVERKPAASIPSSAPSSPRPILPSYASSQPSLLSTPSSSLSLDDQFPSDDDDICFPAYAARPTNPSTAGGTRPHAPKLVITTRRKKSSMPDLREMPEVPLRPNRSFISMGDDAAVKLEPSRHVDYLSHSWREEDIWTSWRHIVASRRTLDNAERLENASWRTWTKSQRRLKTVSPDTLNWMKDHDVTWLYGPLQTSDPNACNPDSPTARSRLSRADSFVRKKPILKRRNISEAMLQRSLSNSTLVRQAVACIASQESSPGVGTITPARFHDLVVTPAPSPHDSSDYFSSAHSHSDTTSTSLDATTPGTEKRHIHFNNKVEQCIAVDKHAEEEEDRRLALSSDDESSDDGMLMMQTPHSKERKLTAAAGNGGTSRRGSVSSDAGSKTTIAMLPATTLKYRGDTPEPPERTRTPGPPAASRRLNHSASAETLKPPRPSNNFLIDDDEEDDPDVGWQPAAYSAGGIPLTYYEDDEELEARGMRRTPSGMFMPYDDADPDAGPDGNGLFGRVVDTVNTARDIAHVIWNVGWRR